MLCRHVKWFLQEREILWSLPFSSNLYLNNLMTLLDGLTHIQGQPNFNFLLNYLMLLPVTHLPGYRLKWCSAAHSLRHKHAEKHAIKGTEKYYRSTELRAVKQVVSAAVKIRKNYWTSPCHVQNEGKVICKLQTERRLGVFETRKEHYF